MTTIKEEIARHSGTCGVDTYETAKPFEFCKWMVNDIQFNTEESRKTAKKVIDKIYHFYANLEEIEYYSKNLYSTALNFDEEDFEDIKKIHNMLMHIMIKHHVE